MIVGIGSDLIDIRRIEKTLERHGSRFTARVTQIGAEPDDHDAFSWRMILSENRFPLFGIMRWRAPARAPAPRA